MRGAVGSLEGEEEFLALGGLFGEVFSPKKFVVNPEAQDSD